MNEKEMLCKIINETKARMQEMCLQHERKMTERDAEIARVKAETKELAKDRKALSAAYQNLQRSVYAGYGAVEKQREKITAFQEAIPLYKGAIREEEQRCVALNNNAEAVAQKVKVTQEENESNSRAEKRKLQLMVMQMKSKNKSLQSDIERKQNENIQLKKIADDGLQITF